MSVWHLSIDVYDVVEVTSILYAVEFHVAELTSLIYITAVLNGFSNQLQKICEKSRVKSDE